MAIELNKDERAQAVESIQRYFKENMEEPIGNIGAGALLAFIVEEIGPSIYNRAVADVQDRMQSRIDDLGFEVHEDEFQYWRKYDRKTRG